jgi:hypothetical protein
MRRAVILDVTTHDPETSSVPRKMEVSGRDLMHRGPNSSKYKVASVGVRIREAILGFNVL